MTLRGVTSTRFTYSGAVNTSSVQTNPLLSLGGCNPDNLVPETSAPYGQFTLDSNSLVPNELIDSQGAAVALGDWITMVDGAAARSVAKVVSYDSGSTTVVLDRALPALPSSGDRWRNSKQQNVFPNLTAAQVSSGLTDYRMLYWLRTNVGTENNFRFFVEPIKPNGCDIALYASGGVELNRCEPLIPDGETSPFTLLGTIANRTDPGVSSSNWERANELALRYSSSFATPDNGSEATVDENFMPIWLQRTIPPTAPPGECVFKLNCYVPDALSQDPTANPANPFIAGFIFSWINPEPVYQTSVTVDRKVFTNGGARVVGTVLDEFGIPVSGINCYFQLLSGPGSLDVDLDAFTDELGQIRSTYTSPSSLSSDPVIRLVLPTNPEV